MDLEALENDRLNELAEMQVRSIEKNLETEENEEDEEDPEWNDIDVDQIKTIDNLVVDPLSKYASHKITPPTLSNSSKTGSNKQQNLVPSPKEQMGL